MSKKIVFLVFTIFFINLVSSAHYITGYAKDALDGESANNHIVTLWNEVTGVLDNVSVVIGPSGPAGYDNVYLIDCEMLDSPCVVGDNLSLYIFDSGDNYVGKNIINIVVSGHGYDLVYENISLNSPVNFENITVDDDFNVVENEIDLIIDSTRKVYCSAIVREFDGESIYSVYSEFYDFSDSYFGDIDDNNLHYTNSSCSIDTNYGDENESEIVCSYDIFYYSDPGQWICEMNVSDGNIGNFANDMSDINSLLALEVADNINFSAESSGNVSDEEEVVVRNVGNVEIDLGLSGYGSESNDGLAMVCSGSQDIPVYYKKYNLTSSTSGALDLSGFENNYINLTSSSFTNDFNLSYRHDDVSDEAFRSTFWRIYVPDSVSGMCSGNIVFSAVMSS